MAKYDRPKPPGARGETGIDKAETRDEHDPVAYFRDFSAGRAQEVKEAGVMNVSTRPKAAGVLRERLKDEDSALSKRLMQGEGKGYKELLEQGYDHADPGLALDSEGGITDLEYARAFIEDELGPLKQELEDLQIKWDEADAEIQSRQKSKDEKVQADREEYNGYVSELRVIEGKIKNVGEEDEDRERKLENLSSLKYSTKVLRDGTEYGKVAKISKETLFQIHTTRKEVRRLEKIKANISDNQ